MKNLNSEKLFVENKTSPLLNKPRKDFQAPCYLNSNEPLLTLGDRYPVPSVFMKH